MPKPKTYEEKESEVREFYEASYQTALRSTEGDPFVMRTLTELEVEFLYGKMQLLKTSISRYYEEQPGMSERLLFTRCEVRLIEKRGPND